MRVYIELRRCDVSKALYVASTVSIELHDVGLEPVPQD